MSSPKFDAFSKFWLLACWQKKAAVCVCSSNKISTQNNDLLLHRGAPWNGVAVRVCFEVLHHKDFFFFFFFFFIKKKE